MFTNKRGVDADITALKAKTGTLETNETADDTVAGLMAKAMSGDMQIAFSATTGTQAATEAGWEKTVTVTLKTAGGATHTWFNNAGLMGVTPSDNSVAGTATIKDGLTHLTFVNGVATVTLVGDAAAWLADETATITFQNVTILGKKMNGEEVNGGTYVVTITA